MSEEGLSSAQQLYTIQKTRAKTKSDYLVTTTVVYTIPPSHVRVCNSKPPFV